MRQETTTMDNTYVNLPQWIERAIVFALFPEASPV